jgi:hypothetical protein
MSIELLWIFPGPRVYLDITDPSGLRKGPTRYLGRSTCGTANLASESSKIAGICRKKETSRWRIWGAATWVPKLLLCMELQRLDKLIPAAEVPVAWIHTQLLSPSAAPVICTYKHEDDQRSRPTPSWIYVIDEIN